MRREEWPSGAISLANALDWIEDFRDAPGYENARLLVLQAKARTQPSDVARLIQTDGSTPIALVSSVVSAWMAQDPKAVQQWLLAMPNGETRDRGLASVVQHAAREGAIDINLLDAFSSDESKARALIQAMRVFAITDSALGRRLIEAHIFDPALRARAEHELDAGPAPITILPGL